MKIETRAGGMAAALMLRVAGAAAAPPAPSACWNFDGETSGLKPVGRPLRFIEAAAVPGTDGKAAVLGVRAQDAGYLTAPVGDATSLGSSYTERHSRASQRICELSGRKSL